MHHKKDKIQSMSFDQCPLAEPSEMSAGADKDEKYSLRHRQRRQTTRPKEPEEPKTSSGRVAKEKKKPKAPPLSKYRRKTANARERTRMREINSAFENLRKRVPPSISHGTPTSTNEKLTKITTLRLAMKYIRTLNDVLSSPYDEPDFLLSHLMGDSPEDNDMILDSQNDNNNSIDHNFNTNNNNNNNTTEIKSNIKTKKRNNKKVSGTATATSSTTKRASKTTSRNRNTKKPEVEKPCLTPPMDNNPVDLGLMLESDGESLHLSEPCLSPLSQTIKPFSYTLGNNGGLELGMFLESDNDSLEFSEPCLSPLGGFDTLSPFGDLLHSGFSEHSSLDIYLT